MTPFTTSKYSRSLLNDTDTSLVAQCSLNWFVVQDGDGIATVTCDQFDDIDCADHQDLEFDTDEDRCLEPSSMPSASPKAAPSVGQENPCVAVIDEDEPQMNETKWDDLWAEFRNKYPRRPFCLLIPQKFDGRNVTVPEAFTNDSLTITHYDITRDYGDQSKAED